MIEVFETKCRNRSRKTEMNHPVAEKRTKIGTRNFKSAFIPPNYNFPSPTFSLWLLIVKARYFSLAYFLGGPTFFDLQFSKSRRFITLKIVYHQIMNKLRWWLFGGNNGRWNLFLYIFVLSSRCLRFYFCWFVYLRYVTRIRIKYSVCFASIKC